MPPGDMGLASAQLKRDMACQILICSGSVRLPAQGRSMFPAIRPGDVLLIEQVSMQSVKVGDVVVTSGDSGFVSHRVMLIGKDAEGGLLIARGDTSTFDDLPVRESDLLGRVAYAIRNGNRISVHPSAIRSVAAAVFRRTFPALRAFTQTRRRLQKSFRTQKESSAQCQS